MSLYEIAMLVLVAGGLCLNGWEQRRIHQRLDRIREMLERTPRYFADAGKPRTNPLPYSYPSKKGFGMSVQNGKAVHDPRPGIEEA